VTLKIFHSPYLVDNIRFRYGSERLYVIFQFLCKHTIAKTCYIFLGMRFIYLFISFRRVSNSCNELQDQTKSLVPFYRPQWHHISLPVQLCLSCTVSTT